MELTMVCVLSSIGVGLGIVHVHRIDTKEGILDILNIKGVLCLFQNAIKKRT